MNTAKKMLFFFDEEDTGYTPSDIPQSEADALIALYNATDGPSWTTNTGWLVDPVVDNWHGITVSGGHVTKVGLDFNGLDGEIDAAIISPLTSLTEMHLYSNAALNCSFAVSDLPTTLARLNVFITASTITGTIAQLPSSMTQISAHSTSCAITGTLADLPSGATQLKLSDSSSLISGGSGVGAAGIRRIEISNLGMSEAQVDEVLEHIYDHWANYTYASPTLIINGTNSAPSGTYQDGDPPTTGKEYVYELINDPDATGNPAWSITYTA